MPKQFTSWSFSRYTDYKTCPLKARLKHLDKIVEPPNEAMKRGSMIHEIAANHLLKKPKRLAPELKKFKDLFVLLRKLHKDDPSLFSIEDSWAFRKDWSRTKWDDWNGCAVRIKLDLAYPEPGDGSTQIVIDWKTGKYRPEQQEAYQEQMELYALAALLMYPGKVIVPKLAYLDHGIMHPDEDNEVAYDESSIDRLKALWATRTQAMLSDTIFAPRANSLCKWCHYRKDNGGPCEY